MFSMLLFHNYLSLKKGMVPHLNWFESPSPKDALCQVWLKLVQWFWRKRLQSLKKCIFLPFRSYLPFGKSVWHFIWTNWITLHPRMLCANLSWHWHSASWEEDKNVKSLQTDGWIDLLIVFYAVSALFQPHNVCQRKYIQLDRQSEKLTSAFRSGELKTKDFYLTQYKSTKICSKINILLSKKP